ncbi:MAG: hypothetical protein WBD41_14315 [Rhodococcus sp. (in: high G+C Gram-positive bacteria)]
MAKSSAFANSDHAYAWLTGDAFRAPTGTGAPLNVFTQDAVPSTGTGTPVLWEPFGAVEAGLDKTPTQTLNRLGAFNVIDYDYKVLRERVQETLKFRALDYSKAAVMTALGGGSIVELGTGSGVFQWDVESGEEFAFLWSSIDGDDGVAYWCPKVTLGTPTGSKIDGKSIDGFDFEIINLAPIKRLRTENDLTKV